MNKKLIVLLNCIALLTLPVVSLAFNSGGLPQTAPGLLVGDLVDVFFTIVWPIVMAFSIMAFIVSAILFMTAQDNPLRLVQARQTLMYGVIGTTIAILAFSLPFIIRNTIGNGI